MLAGVHWGGHVGDVFPHFSHVRNTFPYNFAEIHVKEEFYLQYFSLLRRSESCIVYLFVLLVLEERKTYKNSRKISPYASLFQD